MPFQFMCPAGHLLQAEPEQAGQQSPCPACGVLMIIPPPLTTGPPALRSDLPSQLNGIAESPSSSLPPMIDTGRAVDPPAIEFGENVPAISSSVARPPEIYHIPCPNGHELETPAEMIGQYVMCPTCNAQFQLAEQDSLEFRRQKEIERDARETKAERRWLNWSIAIVILVALGLGTLVLLSVLDQ